MSISPPENQFLAAELWNFDHRLENRKVLMSILVKNCIGQDDDGIAGMAKLR